MSFYRKIPGFNGSYRLSRNKVMPKLFFYVMFFTR